jgi:predicted lipoprotein
MIMKTSLLMNKQHWINKTILTLTLVGLISSCGDFKQEKFTEGPSALKTTESTNEILNNLDGINSGVFSIDKVLLNFGLNVMSPKVESLENQFNNLSSSIDTYCDAITDIDESIYKTSTLKSLREKIKNQWKETIDVYQNLQAFKVGLIASDAEELGLSLYAWPLQNQCRIDLEIARHTGKLDYALNSNVNLRGLGALESLLFTTEGQHNCQSAPDFLQSWINSPIKTRHLDQCTYMKKVNGLIKEDIKKLANEWSIKGNNASLKLVIGKSKAEKLHYLTELSQSLFYVEKIVKDLKLGPISGILNCKKESCPENTENILSKHSLESLIQNLEGFKMAFNGINQKNNLNGMGIDDYLKSEGHESVALSMNEKVENALAHLKKQRGLKTLYDLSIENKNKKDCLETTSTERKVEICAIYQDVRQITSLLKGDYSLALRDIQAPTQAQGDMD